MGLGVGVEEGIDEGPDEGEGEFRSGDRAGQWRGFVEVSSRVSNRETIRIPRIDAIRVSTRVLSKVC